nr:MAG TPA: Putative tail fiber protein [Caudoviricetes sp.]
MATKKYVIQQKQATGDPLTLHPETDADIVKVVATGIQADNVKSALEELNNNIAAITGGGVVTGVKGEAETAYRLGQVNITKANVGLGKVENTSDAEKPISTATQTALDLKADKTEIPDVTDFITKTVNDLTNYYNKTEMGTTYYNKTDIDGKITTINNNISAIPKFAIQVVDTLPTTDISPTTVYLVLATQNPNEQEQQNLYIEYIYIDNKWEKLGEQKLDLSNFPTYNDLTELQTNVLNQVDTKLANYTKTSDLATIATSGKLSDASQDTTHRVVTDTEKTTWNGKQDKLTFDEVPTANSTNPVTSGGVYSAVKTNTDNITKITNGTTVAGKAKQLETARKISLTGDATGETTFDGTANKEIAVTLAASGVTAGTYSAVSVNAKGLVTAGAQLIEVGDKTGTNTPTTNLAIGGLFFKEI